MTVRNFYQPTEPTDWTKELAEVYARQTRQLEEHHANLRQRDQQMVDKAKAEDITKVFSSLASFSTSVAAAVKRHKTAGAEKTSEETERITNLLKMNPAVNLAELSDNYEGKSEELFKSAGFWDYLQQKVGEDNKEFLQELKNLDPRGKVILKETLGRQFSTTLPSLWSDEKSTRSLAGKLEGLSEEQIEEQRVKFYSKKLSKFSPSQEFVAKILFPELDRQGATSRGSAKAVAQANFTQNMIAKAKAIFKTSSGALDSSILPQSMVREIKDRANNFKDIEGGPTRFQQAAESVFNDFQELNENGHIPLIALTGLKDYKFDHPAGKNGVADMFEAFFSKDGAHFNRLVAANSRGQSKLVATAIATDNSFAAELQHNAFNGGSQSDLDKGIQELENRGLVGDKTMTALKKINIEAQTKSNTQIALDKWQPKIDNGLFGVTQSDIDAEENDEVKNNLQIKFNQIQDYNSRHPDLKGSHAPMLHQSYSDLPWGGKLSSTIAQRISDELDLETNGQRATLIWAQYDDKGKLIQRNTDINATIDALKTGLFKSRGGGTKGGNGLYSVDKNGDFSNKRKAENIQRVVKYEHNINWTPQLGNKWSGQVTQQLQNDKYLNSDDSINYKAAVESGDFMDEQDLIGIFTHGDYSDKHYIVAGILNTTPRKLLEATIGRIQSDKQSQQFSETWGLEEQTGRYTPTEVIQQGLESAYNVLDDKTSLKANDIKFLIKKGWKNLQPPQRERIFKYLSQEIKSDEQFSGMNKSLIEIAKAREAELKKRLSETAIEDIESGRDRN